MSILNNIHGQPVSTLQFGSDTILSVLIVDSLGNPIQIPGIMRLGVVPDLVRDQGGMIVPNLTSNENQLKTIQIGDKTVLLAMLVDPNGNPIQNP